MQTAGLRPFPPPPPAGPRLCQAADPGSVRLQIPSLKTRCRWPVPAAGSGALPAAPPAAALAWGPRMPLARGPVIAAVPILTAALSWVRA